MKNILCYGDSNTFGAVPGSMNLEFLLSERFGYTVRWTGLLQQLLGNDYRIIEAGLNGRTTSFNAFNEMSRNRPSRNGLATLPGVLEMHYPLDLVIFMLGTNDLKIEFNASCEQITHGMKQLIDCVKTSHFGLDFNAPKIMLVTPAPMYQVDLSAFDDFFDGTSFAKSNQLAKHYAELANQEHCTFLDAGELVKVSAKDGIHFDQDSHVAFAEALLPKFMNNFSIRGNAHENNSF